MKSSPLTGPLTLSLLLALPGTNASTAVFRVVDGASGSNLLRNPGFEAVQGAFPANWSPAPEGARAAVGEGRSGGNALACAAPDGKGWRGASQTVAVSAGPQELLVVRGWSRAEDVSGAADSGYALYVDLLYEDGTPLWGQTANFSPGTHDWQPREIVIAPSKPVKSLTLHCLLRGHAGRVWFDEISVSVLGATGNAFLLQGTPMTLASTNPAASKAAGTAYTSGDGLRLVLAGQRVVSLQDAGRELAGPWPGGFLARDVAAGSDVFGFEDGTASELGLKLETSIQAHADHIAISGRLQDLRGTDRAILLLFALPVDATAWSWGDDIRRERRIEGRGEFANTTGVGCGTTGTLSLYPLAAVHDARSGLALAVDLGRPAQYRLLYHAAARQLLVAYDFGLVPETERFRGAAEFRLVLYRFDAALGFRGAWEKYMALFPDHFRVRSGNQGIWMPFTDVSTVQGWEDFGFRYHEGDNNVAWDSQHGILSFRYTEPMTWWMPMKPELPRTPAEALRVRDQLAAGGASSPQRMALVSQAAGMFDAEGSPALLFRNEPWANGAVWSLNPSPFLPASPNAATVYWNDAYRSRHYGPGVTNGLAGEYLDSLEGYVTADLNFRREHFRCSTVPLTFSTDTRRPALFKGLAVCEFTRWLSEDVHRLGRLMFANGVPYRFGFLCPWLDVMGTETDWLSGGRYQPPPHSQLCLWRTLAGGKPYLLLMNTDYDRFGPELVERYFQRSLFYGLFPSMFSHNAAENPYWGNPAWYNRDRALFKKYIPLVKRVAEAGWQPVTRYTCDAPEILVERFGPAADGATYLTLFNDSTQSVTGWLRPPAALRNGQTSLEATDLVSGRRWVGSGTGWKVQLDPESVAVVRIGGDRS